MQCIMQYVLRNSYVYVCGPDEMEDNLFLIALVLHNILAILTEPAEIRQTG